MSLQSLLSIPLLTSTAFVLLALTTAMSFLRRKNQMPVDGRLVLITGGSQGMGLSVARQLAGKGASVVIVARTQSKLDAALPTVSACAVHATQRFLAISADMSRHADAQRVFGETRAWAGGRVPDVVWCCAGAAQPGWFKDLAPAALQAQVDANYGSALWTAHAALNAMVASPPAPGAPRRHLVFTSSVLAFYPLAGYNAYSPSKAAIRALTDGLRQECLLYDIDVHCCFPATILTPGFEEEQRIKPELTKILEGSDEGQTPDQVARTCIAALEQGQTIVVSTWLGALLRAPAWGASRRGHWVWDSVLAAVMGSVWWVVQYVMDGEVRKWRRQRGVPKSASE